MRHLEEELAHRKHSINVSYIFLTKEREIPAMPSVHRICPDEKQIINYATGNHSVGQT